MGLHLSHQCLVQAAIARSAKWGTTEPSGRPSPSRQGSQGSGQLEPLGSAGSGGLPSRPPLSGVLDSPRPTKLDALLHAQQLAQQQQQQQSASSGHEAKSGAAGLADRRAVSGQLPATQSAAQFGINAAQAGTFLHNTQQASLSHVHHKHQIVAIQISHLFLCCW